MSANLPQFSYPTDSVGEAVVTVTPTPTMVGSLAMSFRAEAVAVSVLDRRESELIERALNAVASRNPADAEVLRGLIDQLRDTSALLDRTRPLRRPTALGGEPRDE